MKRCSVCGNVQKIASGKKPTAYCGGDKCICPKDKKLKRCIYCGALDRVERSTSKFQFCPASMSQGVHSFAKEGDE